ncbi:hypothetical protein YB2330_002066 [Saitoella coloradoensis]
MTKGQQYERPPPLPVTNPADAQLPSQRNTAAIGTSTAVTRTVIQQGFAFYFRVPVKLFRPTRIDYMALPRALGPGAKEGAPWSWRTSTIGLLFNACQKHGLRFIPDNVLPPLLANSAVGVVLYTTYITALPLYHPPSYHHPNRTWPPPPFESVFWAGASAGAAQAIIAQPLDALQVRFKMNDMLEGKFRSMWDYSRTTLREVGVRSILGGFMLSLTKDALGYGLFFATFEFVKQQGYYSFLRLIYGKPHEPIQHDDVKHRHMHNTHPPHFIIPPLFVVLAGAAASTAHQAISYPLTKIQDIHWSRLETLDYKLRLEGSNPMLAYLHSYRDTFRQCSMSAAKYGGWWRWLYRGFAGTAVRSVPSTSAGLVVFEAFRRKYGGPSVFGGDVLVEEEGWEVIL